ncbi:MAG TPA: DUF3261 domain-containing protein [Candidatus Binatia bacterium]
MKTPHLRRPLRALLVACAMACAGCSELAHGLFAARVPECDGFDVPLATLSVSSRKEMRVRIVGRHVDQDLPFVVEAAKDSFVLVGFTPLGTKSFTLVRRGDDAKDVKIENVTGAVLQIPPRNMMADLLAMSLPSGCAASAEAVATTTLEHWQVSDACLDSRPQQRRIERLPKPGDKPEKGPREEVEVNYDSDAITVSQKQCRYTARYVLQATLPPKKKK